MNDVVSRFQQLDIRCSAFRDWSRLPGNVQDLVVRQLSPRDAAIAAAADKNLDRLSQLSPRWAKLLLGPGQGPLPPRPRQAVSRAIEAAAPWNRGANDRLGSSWREESLNDVLADIRRTRMGLVKHLIRVGTPKASLDVQRLIKSITKEDAKEVLETPLPDDKQVTLLACRW